MLADQQPDGADEERRVFEKGENSQDFESVAAPIAVSMNTTAQAHALSRLPAVKHDAQGHRSVDLRAVIALALPLFVNSSIQALLNLTDT